MNGDAPGGGWETPAQAQETIARQAQEIERLRPQLAQESTAKDLREAFTQAAAAGVIAAPVSHARLIEMIVATAAHAPRPPVEFGAPGIDVRVAWQKGGWITSTGNSFAAPHLAGIVAKILGKHPGLTVFQMKAVLRALAANVARHAPDACLAHGA